MHPILVVDDEQAIAMLIRRILTDAGYRCEAVTDSIKAADLLEKKQYDLVLLDIMMPQIDGYDLLNYIRPHRHTLHLHHGQGGGRGPRARPAQRGR